MKRSLAAWIGIAALAVPGLLAAQTFPTKPLKFVVPFGPAAGADIIARSMARGMVKHLGQPAIVENKAGGNAFIGSQAVLNAPADGHTVLISSNSPVIFNKLLFKSMPYDSIKDFIPVAGFCSGSVLLAAPVAPPQPSEPSEPGAPFVPATPAAADARTLFSVTLAPLTARTP